jgi:hypothetical protein
VASRKKAKPFVKAADTDVPVEKSIEDVKTLVRRHGAAGFGVQEDYRTGRVVVSFVMNTEDGGHLPLQIPIDVNTVFDRMYGSVKNNPGSNQHARRTVGEASEVRRAQAERTAWRQLHLIIDALLTATSLGIMSLADAFMGHVVIVTDEGKSERMGDYLARTNGVLAPGVRALLPSSTSR